MADEHHTEMVGIEGEQDVLADILASSDSEAEEDCHADALHGDPSAENVKKIDPSQPPHKCVDDGQASPQDSARLKRSEPERHLNLSPTSPTSPNGAANDELLRNILNEDDDDVLLEDDPDLNLLSQIIDEETSPTGDKIEHQSPGVGSVHALQGRKVEALVKGMASPGEQEIRQPLRTQRRQLATSGSLLRVQTFASISTDFGHATAVAVRSKFIAAGTVNGTCLIYDHFQTLRATLNPTVKGGPGPIPITALDVSESVDWLCASHLDGRFVLWDWPNAQVLTIVEAKHACGIVHCAFVDMPEGTKEHIVLTADQQGLVNKTSFSKGWLWKTTAKTEVLVNGVKSGRVLALSALRRSGAAHPILDFGLVAMSTEDRDRVTAMGPHTCIARLLPEPQIVRQAPCPSGVQEGTAPYLGWLSPVAGERSANDPCLAIAWGHSLQIVQVSVSPNGSSLIFSQLASHTVSWHFCGVQFLTPESILAQNSAKQLIMLELKSEETSENADIQIAELDPMRSPTAVVYHPYYFNVYGEPQHSYHNSFWASGHVLYLLGIDRVCSCKMLPWGDRLQSLVDQCDWLDALILAMEFYKGSASAVVGLPRKPSLRKTAVRERAEPIILTYLDAVLPALLLHPPGSPMAAKAILQLQDVTAVAIEFLVTIDATDVLYGADVYGRFEAAGWRVLFFELLEPYILSHAITALPAAVLQVLVEDYKDSSRLRRVELCILHLEVDPTKEVLVDLDQLVKLCSEHSLLLALIHVCNNGLGDFVRPLEIISGQMTSETDDTEAEYCAQITLVYLEMVFSGHAIPSGQLSPERATSARKEILKSLFSDNATKFMQLLRLDGEKAMCVLEYGLISQSRSKDKYTVQKYIYDLIGMIVNFDEDLTDCTMISSEEQLLLTMIGHLVADDHITASYQLLKRVLFFLVMSANCGENKNNAQEQMCQMLNKLHLDAYDGAALVSLMEQRGWWQSCAVVHQKAANHAAVVRCMLLSDDKTDVFKYTRGLLGFDGEKPELQEAFKEIVLTNMTALVSASKELTADLVLDYFIDDRLTFMNSLSGDPATQYAYLAALIKKRTILEMRKGQILSETHRQYLSLLCEYAPDEVLEYLRANPNDYSLELALELVQLHGLHEAEAYVQERSGNVKAALEFHLKALDFRLQQFLNAAEDAESQEKINTMASRDAISHQSMLITTAKTKKKHHENILSLLPQLPEMDEVIKALRGAMDLCIRKGSEEPEQHDVLWFALLDKVAKFTKEAFKAKSPLDDFVEGGGTGAHMLTIMQLLFRIVLSNMVDSEEQPSCKPVEEKLRGIFDKLLLDYGNSTLGEMRDCFSDLFSRAEFHMQSRKVALQLENLSTYTHHVKYHHEFKKGDHRTVEDADQIKSQVDEQHPEIDLQARLCQYEEKLLASNRRKSALQTSVLNETALLHTDEKPIRRSIRHDLLPARTPNQPMDQEAKYYNQADVFELLEQDIR